MALVAFWSLSWLACLCAVANAGRNAKASPISLPSTELWEGIDGNWSTFWVQVGTPRQTLRVLPGTSALASTSTWVVLQQGCSVKYPAIANCTNIRGSTFNPNVSSSWTEDGLPDKTPSRIQVALEAYYLGLIGSVQYGLDTISLGLWAYDLPELKSQLIGGITTQHYWLGFLGLSTFPTWLSEHQSAPSLLTNLYEGGYIASESWGYFAGAYYHRDTFGSQNSYGSLTLGGYDSNQYDATTSLNEVPFNKRVGARDISVTLLSVIAATHDVEVYSNLYGGVTLLSEPISVYIDFVVTELYFPKQVCDVFQAKLGLTWNEDYELYFINETARAALKSTPVTFNFTIKSPYNSHDKLTFTFPYAAFDLFVQPPLVNESTSYFPLKRATDNLEYILGRVFLQEAYIVADYGIYCFTIGQATHVNPMGGDQLLTRIDPTSPSSSASASAAAAANTPKSISGGGIAGIVIAVLALIVGCILAWLCARRTESRRRERAFEAELQTRTRIPPPPYTKQDPIAKANAVEIDGGLRHELDGSERTPEMQGSKLPHELDPRNERLPELRDPRTAHEADDLPLDASDRTGRS